MLRIVSPEEAKHDDDEAFSKIEVGTLFSYHLPFRHDYDSGNRQQLCIAKVQIEPDRWTVIPLTPQNRRAIIAGTKPKVWTLTRERLSCINIIDEVE